MPRLQGIALKDPEKWIRYSLRTSNLLSCGNKRRDMSGQLVAEKGYLMSKGNKNVIGQRQTLRLFLIL